MTFHAMVMKKKELYQENLTAGHRKCVPCHITIHVVLVDNLKKLKSFNRLS